MMPTTKAKKGDILLIDKKPKCVIENNGTTIKVMSYFDSTIQEIVPERNIFLGKTYFFRKIVSMFGTGGALKGKGSNKLLKMIAMKEIFSGMSGGGSDNPFASMLPMIFMCSMFGGKDGFDFDDMFDLGLDFDEDDEADKKTETKADEKK